MTTPTILIDQKQLAQNCQAFKDNFKNFQIYYSVKANNNISVLKIIHDSGLGFDVASWNEIKLLKSIEVKPEHIVFSAPTKIPSDIANAFAFGINRFAFDSKMELEKLAKLAPGSKVYVRLSVDNEGSEWPLIRKFGVETDEAIDLFKYSKSLGLEPFGITFHVGSQNLNPRAWANAIDKAYNLYKNLLAHNISLKMIDIGGGYPVTYLNKAPSLEKISNFIVKKIDDKFHKEIEFYIEPGRSLVGNTGKLIASVINRAKRTDGKEWLYLDTGVYHGLQETIEGFKYQINTSKDTNSKKKKEFIICGPTCDSTDKIMEAVLLPDELTVGDIVEFHSAGAYTNSYEHYNGFQYPPLVISDNITI